MMTATKTTRTTARIYCPACQGDGVQVGQAYRGSLDIDVSSVCPTCDGARKVDVESLALPMLITALAAGDVFAGDFAAAVIWQMTVPQDDPIGTYDAEWATVPASLRLIVESAVDAHFDAVA